jgi:hypothetical protein
MVDATQCGMPTDAPQGYYDGTTDDPAVYVLERVRYPDGRDKPGCYLLKRQIRYVSADGRAWVVPAEPDDEFVTDLASIPALAAWLVPKDGTHTPAALIHDAMVLGRDELPAYAPADPEVPRDEADRLFLEGMELLGVRFLRRWLMWAAVSIPTLCEPAWRRLPDGRREAIGWQHWPRRALVALLALFAVAGVLGVPDVIDLPGSITVWSWLPLVGGKVVSWQLHWVDEASLPREVLSLLTVVVAGSLAYAVLWWRRWRFGLAAGLGLGVLAFPMLVPAIAFAGYRVLEEVLAFVLIVKRRRAAKRRPRLTPEQRGPQGEPRVRSALWVDRLAKRVAESA